MFHLRSSPSPTDLDQISQIEAFRKNAQLCVDYVCDYTKNVANWLVFPDVTPGYLRPLLPRNPPENPEHFKDMLKDFQECIIPGTMHWQHPNMYAYFACGNSFSNVLADMLATAIGGVGFSWVRKDILKIIVFGLVCDWVLRLYCISDAKTH